MCAAPSGQAYNVTCPVIHSHSITLWSLGLGGVWVRAREGGGRAAALRGVWGRCGASVRAQCVDAASAPTDLPDPVSVMCQSAARCPAPRPLASGLCPPGEGIRLHVRALLARRGRQPATEASV